MERQAFRGNVGGQCVARDDELRVAARAGYGDSTRTAGGRRGYTPRKPEEPDAAPDTGTGSQGTSGDPSDALTLLRTLALAPRRTVRVVLFAAEEFGGDGGDAYLATHADELDRHVAALEADSGCFAPDGFSVRADAAVVARLAALAEPLTPLGAGSVRAGWAGVDIGPIVERGVPGIGIRTKNARYFDYHHSAADTLDKIDPAELAANVTATAALLWAIADDPVSLRAAPAAATSESLSARGPG